MNKRFTIGVLALAIPCMALGGVKLADKPKPRPPVEVGVATLVAVDVLPPIGFTTYTYVLQDGGCLRVTVGQGGTFSEQHSTVSCDHPR